MYMKRIIAIGLLLAFIFPVTVSAAWWKPATWKLFQKKATTTEMSISSTTSETLPTAQSFVAPSTDELLKRIAELENKLDQARAGNKGATVFDQSKTAVPQTSTETSASLSLQQVTAKVRPAIVAVETATSSGSGVIIDAQGHMIVSAYTVLIKNSAGDVVNATEEVSVVFSNGTKKTAKLIGFNENYDIAFYKISGSGPFTFVKMVHDAGVKVGDTVYVFGSSAMRDTNGGADIAQGTVTVKTTTAIELNSSVKPFDNSGAVVNSRGEFVGIPKKSSCKVLEEGQKCLTYKISADVVKSSLTKIGQGMRLYKNKKNSTKEELLVGGQLSGVSATTKNNGSLEYAISSLSGKNSFDYVNAKLTDDQEGKITKIYLNKLKVGADSLSKAADSLKAQSHAFNVFFIEHVAEVLTLGDYQKNIVQKIEVDNRLKLKEYEKKLSYWSTKKNEYDGLLTRPADATHDYLLEEGMAMEAEVKYFIAEQQRIMDSVSSEVISLF